MHGLNGSETGSTQTRVSFAPADLEGQASAPENVLLSNGSEMGPSARMCLCCLPEPILRCLGLAFPALYHAGMCGHNGILRNTRKQETLENVAEGVDDEQVLGHWRLASVPLLR